MVMGGIGRDILRLKRFAPEFVCCETMRRCPSICIVLVILRVAGSVRKSYRVPQRRQMRCSLVSSARPSYTRMLNNSAGSAVSDDVVANGVCAIDEWVTDRVRLLRLVVTDDQPPANCILVVCLHLKTHRRPHQRGKRLVSDRRRTASLASSFQRRKIDIRIMLGRLKRTEFGELWKKIQCRPPVEVVMVDVYAPLFHIKLERMSHDTLQPCHGPLRTSDGLHQGTETGSEGRPLVRHRRAYIYHYIHRLSLFRCGSSLTRGGSCAFHLNLKGARIRSKRILRLSICNPGWFAGLI